VLDGVVFAAPARPFARVMVAGCWRELRHAGRAAAHRDALQALWGSGHS
jgi:hypothetical protein